MRIRGLALVASAVAGLLAAGRLVAGGGAPEVMVVAQLPVRTWASALAFGASPSPPGEGGRLVLVSPGGRPRVLTSSFRSAADPEVSFDGRSLLFAAQRSVVDPWCVNEMPAGGGEARQVTCGQAGARQPVYLPTVYTITPTNVEPWVQIGL